MWKGDRGEGRWRQAMRTMGGHQKWPASIGIVYIFAAQLLYLYTFVFGDTRDYFRQPRRSLFKCVYKNCLINLNHISKPLTLTTQHTLSTIWLITDDLGHEGPRLVWLHRVCRCEASKFSKMPLETASGKEMTIEFRCKSSGRCSTCSQRASCTLPFCHICGSVMCNKICTFSNNLVGWAAWGTPVQ